MIQLYNAKIAIRCDHDKRYVASITLPQNDAHFMDEGDTPSLALYRAALKWHLWNEDERNVS